MPTIPLWLGLAAAIPLTWSPLTVYFVITLIVSLFGWTGLARDVRGRFLALRDEDFVTAASSTARASAGSSSATSCLRSTSHILAVVTLALPTMIVAETALSLPRHRPEAAGRLLGRAAAGGAEHPHHRDRPLAAVWPSAPWSSRCSPSTSSATACAMPPIPTRTEGTQTNSRRPWSPDERRHPSERREPLRRLPAAHPHPSRGARRQLRAHARPDALPRRRERLGQERHRALAPADHRQAGAASPAAASSCTHRRQRRPTSRRSTERSREMLRIRGGRIGLIFQEPMSSLSPVHTIGSQIVEALRLHRKHGQARGPRRGDRAAAPGRDRQPRGR